MEYLFEFILELVLEGGIEASKSDKVPKFIRYPLIVIITLLYLSIIVLIILIGLSLLDDYIFGGIVIISIGILFLVLSIIKFGKTQSIKNKEKSKEKNID